MHAIHRTAHGDFHIWYMHTVLWVFRGCHGYMIRYIVTLSCGTGTTSGAKDSKRIRRTRTTNIGGTTSNTKFYLSRSSSGSARWSRRYV